MIVLLIVQRDKPTGQEDVLKNRLENALRWQVRVQTPDHELPPPEDFDFVVISSRRAPPDIRKLDKPVLVCNAFALFEVGMTMAKQGVDFGMQQYSTVFVGPDSLGQPLPAAMMARVKSSEEQAYQGWAKPGDRALTVATTKGDPTRAVAFAYNKCRNACPSRRQPSGGFSGDR